LVEKRGKVWLGGRNFGENNPKMERITEIRLKFQTYAAGWVYELWQIKNGKTFFAGSDDVVYPNESAAFLSAISHKENIETL
jgi:hypothetical protein